MHVGDARLLFKFSISCIFPFGVDFHFEIFFSVTTWSISTRFTPDLREEPSWACLMSECFGFAARNCMFSQAVNVLSRRKKEGGKEEEKKEEKKERKEGIVVREVHVGAWREQCQCWAFDLKQCKNALRSFQRASQQTHAEYCTCYLTMPYSVGFGAPPTHDKKKWWRLTNGVAPKAVVITWLGCRWMQNCPSL